MAETIVYDKLPENYDLADLVKKTDTALYYFTGKIKYYLSQAITGCCIMPPPTVTWRPDHSFEVIGRVDIDDRVYYTYTALVNGNSPDYMKVTLFKDNILRAVRLAKLDEQSICSIMDDLHTMSRLEYAEPAFKD